MSTDLEAIISATNELLARHAEARGGHDSERLDRAAWLALGDSGFTTIAVPEACGGSGGDLSDQCAVIEVIGARGLSLPIVESSLVAGRLLALAGLDIGAALSTCSVGDPRDAIRTFKVDGEWRIEGQLHHVPWAAEADRVVFLAAHDDGYQIISVSRDAYTVTDGWNVANETRNTVSFASASVETACRAPEHVEQRSIRKLGALGRAAAMSGALSTVTKLTLGFAQTRRQFGKPLSEFQAVQRHLVRMVEHEREAHIAVHTAIANADADHEPDLFDVAAAKIVAAGATKVITSAAHQVHGAIGMTMEYELGHLSRRLWAWSEEFGGERYWSTELGQLAVHAGADQLWPRISIDRSARFDR